MARTRIDNICFSPGIYLYLFLVSNLKDNRTNRNNVEINGYFLGEIVGVVLFPSELDVPPIINW